MRAPDVVKHGNFTKLKLTQLLKELFKMTPDLLEEKETALNEIVGKRLKTEDSPEKGDKKVVVLYAIEVILRIEVSRVEEGKAVLVSLEVQTSFAVVVILVVLSRAVEIRGLDVRSLAADEVLELADSEARDVTVRLRDGNAVFKDS